MCFLICLPRVLFYYLFKMSLLIVTVNLLKTAGKIRKAVAVKLNVSQLQIYPVGKATILPV